MVFVIYAAEVLTRFDRLLLIGPRSTTTNLRKLAACVVPARWFTVHEIRCQRKSENCAVFNAPSEFLLCNFKSVSTSMGTKKGCIYGKGAPFKGAPQTFGGAVAPNCPP